MRFAKKKITKKKLLALYRALLLPRRIEERMLLLLRQGQISKWFSGIGQEAIAVGVTEALEKDEYILPLHRNLGVFTSRDIPLHRLFAQWQGKKSGFTQGRDRSFHFGTQSHRIVGMISHLGPQLGVACGIALSHKQVGEPKLCAVFSGEGGTSEGDFHEALNLASVWQLPVLFCIENNGYGLSTPSQEQYAVKDLAERGAGYAMESYVVNGNNILEVYHTVKKVANEMRQNPHPVLIEFKTFRQRGHEEASGTEYVPKSLQKKWKTKDPVKNYENFLLKSGILSETRKEEITSIIDLEIQQEWNQAKAESEIKSNESSELESVYQSVDLQTNKISNKIEKRFVDALQLGLDQAFAQNPDLIFMGQDIGAYGGVFKVSDGLLAKYGQKRVRNTPLCESVVISCAYGYALTGKKALVEMQFADFVSSGFTAVVNLLAKSYYRWGQTADVVIRMPCGGGVNAGPFHSQSNEAWFTTVPGLKVVYPAFPEEAKALFLAAIADPNPVLFFEHKKLYRTIKGPVSVEPLPHPLGKALCRQKGEALTLITYGLGVHWALEALEKFISNQIEVIELNSLVPWDQDTVFASVRKTNRVLLLQEDSQFGGYMGEIAAQIAEHCFEYLDAPVARLGALDTPVPFANGLEQIYLPHQRLVDKIKEVLNY